ncbi:MAG TPA: alkaline phosphatase family protein [Bryobacteraceae bacterium]|nr:alkaline phosphatase family protein [Bryobacteraceae bacterium]
MSISRRRFTATLAGVTGFLPASLRALPPRPKLFVFLFAEQFRQIYLDRIKPLLVPAGFRELISKGIYYPNCRLAASSFTSTGLASLATGAYPQLHGIVADQWYDRRSRAVAKARAELLEATTLADELSHAGNSRIYCLGLNEAATSLLAGRSKAQVFWMDPQGAFTTRGTAPDWLVSFNRSWPASDHHNEKWNAIGAQTNTPALPALRILTFDPKRPEEFMALYLSSPFGQSVQFELLIQLIVNEKLGQGDTLDFVFASLGSMALLGYETGSDSDLMVQMATHLDRQIERTFKVLNQTPGRNRYNLIFAGAHGALADPGALLHSQQPIASENVARAIEQGFVDWLDKGVAKSVYVDKYIYPFLYLKLEQLRERNMAPRAARRLAGEVALRVPGVAGYYTVDGDCSHSGEWRRMFQNSFNERRSGDVMLSYAPGAVEDFNSGRGVSYGSLYNYDTQVPLFLYGPQFGKRQIEREIESVDLAPTIARAAGTGMPSSATGNVLAEAFADAFEDEREK